MKKLNKLLMPVVGLSTIAMTAIPLAACSKKSTYTDGVKVTADEWADALTYLTASELNATWQSKGDDSFEVSMLDSGTVNTSIKFTDIAFNDDLASTRIYELVSQSNLEDTGQYVSIAKNNMYFSYVKADEEVEWRCDGIELMSTFQKYFIYVIGTVGEKTDDYKFDDKSKQYTFSGEVEYEGEKGTTTLAMRFDSNKKITYINYHTTFVDDEGKPSCILALNLHPQYNKVSIDVPNEVILRADANIFQMTESTKSIESRKDNYIIANATADAKSTKLTVKQKVTSTDVNPSIEGIYVNDKYMVLNEDYTYSDGLITFAEPISKDDKINLGLHVNSNATAITLTWA